MKSAIGLSLALLKQGLDPAQIVVRLALRKALIGCSSALDIGCGSSLAMRQIGVPNTVGIDGYEPCIVEARKLHTHDQLVHGDVTNLAGNFKPRQFDACVALDLIEHLTKEAGLKLMREMEQIARRRVVIFTPSGFLPQGHAEADDLQAHHSGWEPAEMEKYGYNVIGLLGPKKLRGEYHTLMRPAILWGPVSLLGHFLWTRWHPQRAAAILCVKAL
jgi:hypothetical protein